MKPIFAILLLALATSVQAANTSASHGHHGGNSGAVGAAPGAFGGSSSAAAAGQSGNGGRYSMVDEFQPWPQAEMAQFQKPEFVPFAGK